MPIAAIIALAEQYGPTVFGLAIKYGPMVVSLARQYGPTLEAEVWPLIQASAQAGTLEQDVSAIVAKLEALAPLVGEISSLSDIADAVGSIGPSGAPVESPALEKAAGHSGLGPDRT